jgi:hypothetical protein
MNSIQQIKKDIVSLLTPFKSLPEDDGVRESIVSILREYNDLIPTTYFKVSAHNTGTHLIITLSENIALNDILKVD